MREGIYLIRKSRFLRSKRWYIYIHTYTGGRDPEVAGFLFTYFYSLSSSSHGMIYRSLERHFHVEYNAFEIVGIGSVFMEIFTYYFRDMGIEGYTSGNASKHPHMAI